MIAKAAIRFALLQLVLCLGLSPAHGQNTIEMSLQGKLDSLAKVRDEVRRLRRAGRTGHFVVTVRQGDYFVEENTFFGAADAGITFRSAPDETVRFVGGKVIKREWFKPVEDEPFLSRLATPSAANRIYEVDLKANGITEYGELARHGWSIEPWDRIPPATLTIDKKRMTLARWPNVGDDNRHMVYKHYLEEDRPLNGYEIEVQKIIAKTRLPGEVTLTRVIDPGGRYRDKGKGGTFEVAFDRIKHWGDVQNIFLDGVLGSTWEWTYNRLASIDVERKQITLASPELNGIARGESVRLPHFHFENIPEEIDAPEEYFLNRKTGRLYLYPPEQIGTVLLATLDQPVVTLVRTSDIRFEGLQFDTGRHLAIDIKNCNKITIENCDIAKFTLGGIRVEGKNIRIINTHVHAVGGFGIAIKGGDLDTLEPANNEVVNCHLHDFGWDQKSQLPGILVDGVGHRIANNEIHDGPHFAIRLRHVNDVVVEHNEIYDLPKYHKFDGGAIYIYSGDRAECRGNVIRANYFHDIPTIGVYPDNFTWGVTISHNVFRNVGIETNRPPIYVNGGGECESFNNLMVDCVLMYIQGARPKEERWFESWNKTKVKFANGRIDQTPFKKYPDLKEWLTKQNQDEFFRPQSRLYNNVLVHPKHEVYQTYRTTPTGKKINTQQIDEMGIRDNSGTLVKSNNWATKRDPGFRDYARGDFSLQQSSPVFLKVDGFEPIPFDKMGRNID